MARPYHDGATVHVVLGVHGARRPQVEYANDAIGVPRGHVHAAGVKRRKLKLKARFESMSSHFSFKCSHSGAFNMGLIGSTCTTIPGSKRSAVTPPPLAPPREPPPAPHTCRAPTAPRVRGSKHSTVPSSVPAANRPCVGDTPQQLSPPALASC